MSGALGFSPRKDGTGSHRVDTLLDPIPVYIAQEKSRSNLSALTRRCLLPPTLPLLSEFPVVPLSSVGRDPGSKMKVGRGPRMGRRRGWFRKGSRPARSGHRTSLLFPGSGGSTLTSTPSSHLPLPFRPSATIRSTLRVVPSPSCLSVRHGGSPEEKGTNNPGRGDTLDTLR